jgi:hypothetical protein
MFFPMAPALVVQASNQTLVIVVDDRFVTTTRGAPPESLTDGFIPATPTEFLDLVVQHVN